MITNLQYLRIYPDAIDTAISRVEEAMEGLGFGAREIQDMHDEAFSELEEVGNWENITNSIIFAYYRTAEAFILERYPGATVDYYVNGTDSPFEVSGVSLNYGEEGTPEEWSEEKIRDDWDGALSELSYDDISTMIGWGFSRKDLDVLMGLHRSGKHRKKIEDLLEDCNFHTECRNWHDGNYTIT